MSRPILPKRSGSTLSAGPPTDAELPDDKAINDVYRSVEELGSLELAAKKLQQIALERAASTSGSSQWADDPEEAGYMVDPRYRYDEDEDDAVFAQQQRSNGYEGREDVAEVVHLQEVVEGLWIGDLVAAMDIPGLQERGIVRLPPMPLQESS